MIFAKERSLPLAYQLECNLQVFGCLQGSKIRCSLLRKDSWIWSCVKTRPLLFRLKKAVEPQLMGRNGDGKKPQDSVFGVVWLRPWASEIRQTSHLRLFDTVSYVILWSWRCFSVAFQALKKITNSMSVIHSAKGSSINTEAKHFLSRTTNNPSWTPPNGVRSAIYWTRGTYRQDNSIVHLQQRNKYIEQMIAHFGFPKGTKKRNRIEEAHHSSEMYLYILPVLNPQ